MLSLAEVYQPIRADLEACGQIFRDELGSDQSFISDICRHVEQFHGKLLRPAFLLLSADVCGGVRPAHHVLAAVVEMVHIATLVHDDVLDQADIRRRAATVNRLWGVDRAVLMGDFLFSHAYHLCSSLSDPFAARFIGQTAITLCEGEMMQGANCDNLQLSEAEYFDIINRKTASLIGACGLLGARYAGTSESVARRMRDCGAALGVAFQITDDLLDLTGDEAEAGKSLGRDVHMGKMTLPLIHFLQNADADARADVTAILRGSDPQRYREVARRLEGSESIEYASRTAAECVCQAREILESLPPGDSRASLIALADFVLARRC